MIFWPDPDPAPDPDLDPVPDPVPVPDPDPENSKEDLVTNACGQKLQWTAYIIPT